MHGFNLIVGAQIWTIGVWFWINDFKLEVFSWYTMFFQVFVPITQVLDLWISTLKLKPSSGNSKIRVVHSSEESFARAWKLSSQKFYKILQTARARTRFTQSPARATVEREFHTTSTFAKFADRSSDHLCFWTPARVKEVTLERRPCFQQILRNSFKCIFASSCHSKCS